MEKQARIIGTLIRDKRLSLNLRMDDVAQKANITRSTLWSIESGNQNYSFRSLLAVLNVLSLSLSIEQSSQRAERSRASRINRARDKKINRFVIMCVEQYASSVRKSSQTVYEDLSKAGIISELENDYEDLHGMSTPYINDYIETILRSGNNGFVSRI